jgi:hypothetical protein
MKRKIVVTWTQELSVEREVECDTAEAAEEALAIDPNDIDPKTVIFGDIVSDVEAMVDGETVGVNNCPFED